MSETKNLIINFNHVFLTRKSDGKFKTLKFNSCDIMSDFFNGSKVFQIKPL